MTLKLELPEETLNEVVECWQSEEGQLEMILLHWREKQGDTEDLAKLKKALKGLETEGKIFFVQRSNGNRKIRVVRFSYLTMYLNSVSFRRKKKRALDAKLGNYCFSLSLPKSS